LLEKSGRFEDRYAKACELEEEYAFNVPAAPKNKIIHFIEYTYVTFKSNQTPKKALELFVKEPTSSKIIRRILCINDDIKDNVELDEQVLDCGHTVDPDQVLWNNIGFSIQEQNARNIIAFLVKVFTAIMSVIITF
tara:strand:- start:180 stop:587 length:408 start_codon:yes stop_codon:yes gene_type:complete